MANQPFEIPHRDKKNPAKITVWLCDVDTLKPTGGFSAGDEAWCLDTENKYIATSATTWNNRFIHQLLATKTGIDMQTVASTDIYTTPATPSGKYTYITCAVVREISGSLSGGTSYSITGLRSLFSLAAAATASQFIVVRSADLQPSTKIGNSAIISLSVVTGSTVARTATIDLFGYIA